MLVEDEEVMKKDLEKRFSKEDRNKINTIFAQMEAELNFCQTKWEKSMMFLHKLDEAGLKVIKK